MKRSDYKLRSAAVYGKSITDPACCRNCLYLDTYYHGFQDGKAVFSYCCALMSGPADQPYHLTAADLEETNCSNYERRTNA